MSASKFFAFAMMVIAHSLSCQTHPLQIGILVATFDIMLHKPVVDWFHPSTTCETKLTLNQRSTARAEIALLFAPFSDNYEFKHLLLQELPREWVAPERLEKGRTAFAASLHVALKHTVRRFHSGSDKDILTDIWKTLNIDQRRQFLFSLMVRAPNLECVHLPGSFKFAKPVFPI